MGKGGHSETGDTAGAITSVRYDIERTQRYRMGRGRRV